MSRKILHFPMKYFIVFTLNGQHFGFRELNEFFITGAF